MDLIAIPPSLIEKQIVYIFKTYYLLRNRNSHLKIASMPNLVKGFTVKS